IHDQRHVLRAGQEGIVAALTYGFNIMKEMGLNLNTVKAGKANMFLSPLFREAFVNMNDVSLELYDTDGSQGAARGAGMGSKIYNNASEAFQGLEKVTVIEPQSDLKEAYKAVFHRWESTLNKVK
ncbi:MAG: carbohydrate kinase, partial [Cyclobacteriaceae bacterium]